MEFVKVALLIFLSIKVVFAATKCEPCYCEESSGVVMCAGMYLQEIPVFSRRISTMAKVLNLRNNFLIEVKKDLLKSFPQLKVLDVRGNAINCASLETIRNIILVQSDCVFQDMTAIKTQDMTAIKTDSISLEPSDGGTRDTDPTENILDDFERFQSDINDGMIVMIFLTTASTGGFVVFLMTKYKRKVNIYIFILYIIY